MRDHFASFMGPERALDNPNDLAAYGYDASGQEGKARLVLFPETAEELRKIFTYANRTNIPVVPRGLGANPRGMVVPKNAIVLDMAGFDRIRTINLNEGWIVVESGVVLADLQRLLARHERAFPVNPESRNVATVGALLAMNQMDRRSHKNGRLRQHVESLEVIDGTGKYYAAIDPKFVGMEGTSAIIISARIKLLPLVERTTTTLVSHERLHDCLAAVEEFDDDLTVLSLEYLNPLLSGLVGLPEKHHLLVEHEGDAGEIVTPDDQQRLWKAREGAWDAATAAGFRHIGDCQATINQAYDIINWCEEQGLPVAAHIGQGIIHPFFESRDARAFDDMVAETGADPGGQFGYGLTKKRFVPDNLKDVFLAQKDEYDYNDIVNRGVIHDYA